MPDHTDSWKVCISSDDVLNFIVYIGCVYGLIENDKYKGKEILWPQKSLNTKGNSREWEKWLEEAIHLEAERIKDGEHPYTLVEEYKPPEFLGIEPYLLRECCRNAWPKFAEWWYMAAGGKNALSFLEGVISNNLSKYVTEVESKIGRKIKPFQLYISLLYTGLNEAIDIRVSSDQYLIVTSDPFRCFNGEGWIKKLYEIG